MESESSLLALVLKMAFCIMEQRAFIVNTQAYHEDSVYKPYWIPKWIINLRKDVFCYTAFAWQHPSTQCLQSVHKTKYLTGLTLWQSAFIGMCVKGRNILMNSVIWHTRVPMIRSTRLTTRISLTARRAQVYVNFRFSSLNEYTFNEFFN
jgi:hypothetical protein